MKKTIFRLSLLLLAALISEGLLAQSKREEKWQTAINALKETEFITKYKEFKERIEANVTQFHIDMTEKGLSEEEIEAVAAAYENSVEKFDKLLDKLKTDFTDPTMRKELAKSSDRYTEVYVPNLEKAYATYMNDCQLKIDRLTGGGRGAIGIGEVQMLLAMGNMVYKIVEQQQAKMAKLSASFFEQNFINDLRLKRWEEY